MMETVFLDTSDSGIERAAELLRQGEAVGIPTETVYGLAADALDPAAVEKIFTAKGRPQDNPLIVHIADIAELERYAENIPDLAYTLAEKFWPGPLTMVLPKLDIVPNITSGGLDTVGIRMPAHPAARRIIKACGRALAAPSANTSGSPSPTTAAHVMHDLGGKIPAIVDGGSCPVGVESTVIAFEEGNIRLLRPGFVSAEELSEYANVVRDRHITEDVRDNEAVRSPGMKYKHYSPNANITIVCGGEKNFLEYVASKAGDGVFAMIFGEEAARCPIQYIAYGNTPAQQAAELFSALRLADELGAKQVYARCPETNGVGLAVYNRLLRAAGFEIVTF